MADRSKMSLEDRVRELEDVREIQELFYDWHDSNTGGFDGKHAGRLDFLNCLTDDGTIEIQALHAPGKGPRGRDQYSQFTGYYEGDNGPLPYVFQASLADKIEIDGDRATHRTVQIGIFQFRKPDGELAPASVGLSQRVNSCVRTPNGWRIEKSTAEGGFSFNVDELHGNLNELPQIEQRTPWTYKE